MNPRIDTTRYMNSAPAQAMFALQQAVQASGLEPTLLHLVKIRASQMNGCAYCIDMHSRDLLILLCYK